MEPEWERAREPSARRAWSDLLAPFAAELVVDAREVSELAVVYMRSKLPALFPDDESVEATRASTEAHIRAFAEMVRSGADPGSAELPAATVADAQTRVRRGIPIAPLLRSYRLGHETIWQWMLPRLCARTGEATQLADATELGSAWLFAYIDAAAALGEQFYTAEQERWLRSAAASRAETISAILSGEERDPRRASGRLRYEIDRHHLGVIAWTDGAVDGADPHAACESAVAQLGSAIGAEGSLVQPLGAVATAAWLSRTTPFDATTLEAARVDPPVAQVVRVATGEPATGLAGFKRTHVEATHARRVASLSRRAPGTITRYGRVALSAMATIDWEQAELFVERTLGELASDDDLARRLSATLSAYLDENASRGRAAKRLGVHENTISYRVRQAEEILGRSIEHDTLALRVALALVPAVRESRARPR